MRNKKTNTIIGIFSIIISFGFLININSVVGYTGAYEKRTDSTNPFIFTVDILYYNDNFSVIEIEEMIHQVFLKEGVFYLIYVSSGILYSGDYDTMKIHLGNDEAIDYLYIGFEQRYQGKSVYLFKPSETGFYNITIRLGKAGFDSWSSMQIGVLELPSVNLNDVVDWSQWDFESNAITTIRINLEGGWYEIGGLTEDEIPWNFPSAEIYYINLATYHTMGDHLFELIENGSYLNGTERSFFFSDEYLFYSFSADSFGIREHIQEPVEPDLIPSFNPLIIIGIISIVSAITIKKRLNRLN